jgi:hypothetical protein
MSKSRQNKESARFSELAQAKRPSLISEFWYFLKHNKKWWLLPILLVLLLLCVLVLVGGSGIAPLLYPLF